MAEAISVPALTAPSPTSGASQRHSAVVRITHWANAISFICLLVSGIAILLAHPRLYWGETGAVGGPSLIDLPLPFVLDISVVNLRGPGRYIHFLSAWVCVLTGLLYIVSGVMTRRFRRELFPRSLSWRGNPSRTPSPTTFTSDAPRKKKHFPTTSYSGLPTSLSSLFFSR